MIDRSVYPALADTAKMLATIQHLTERGRALERLAAWRRRLEAGEPIAWDRDPTRIELCSRPRQGSWEVAIGAHFASGRAAIRWAKDGRETRFTHPYWPPQQPPVGDPDWQRLCELAESIDATARTYCESDDPGERSSAMARI